MTQAPHDPNFAVTFSVDRAPQEAFEAITNVRGWWSKDIQGVTDRVGGEFAYHYKDVHRCTIRVTELVPARKVAWLVKDNYFNFIEDQAEWTGTEVVFEISEKDGGAEVHFTHVGLVPQYECYDVCSNAWGGYLSGSLRNLINTGQGQPNPKEDGNAPAHQHGATALRARRLPQAAGLANTESPKASPASVAGAIFNGVQHEEEEIFPDSMSQTMAAGWRTGAAKALEREYAAAAAAGRA